MNFQVDFICIGAQRSGSTWLDKVLRSHNEVRLPFNKEVNFFNDYIHFEALSDKISNYEKGIEWYKSNFPDVEAKVTGEVTPAYMDRPEVPQRIKKHFPDVKLIVMLRNPVERTYSNYLFYKEYLQLDQSNTFEEAIKKYPEYLNRSKYYIHLKRYLELFPRKNIHIILLEDVAEHPDKILKDLCSFLNISNFSMTPLHLHPENAARSVHSRFFAKFVNFYLPGVAPKLTSVLLKLHLSFFITIVRKLHIKEAMLKRGS